MHHKKETSLCSTEPVYILDGVCAVMLRLLYHKLRVCWFCFVCHHVPPRLASSCAVCPESLCHVLQNWNIVHRACTVCVWAGGQTDWETKSKTCRDVTSGLLILTLWASANYQYPTNVGASSLSLNYCSVGQQCEARVCHTDAWQCQ